MNFDMNFDTREMTSDKPVALAQLNARIKLFRKCMTPRAPVVTAELHWIDNLFHSAQHVSWAPRSGTDTKLAITRTGHQAQRHWASPPELPPVPAGLPNPAY